MQMLDHAAVISLLYNVYEQLFYFHAAVEFFEFLQYNSAILALLFHGAQLFKKIPVGI